MGSGHRTEDSGQETVDCKLKSADCGQWTVHNRHGYGHGHCHGLELQA
jgi:hypothetical protein